MAPPSASRNIGRPAVASQLPANLRPSEEHRRASRARERGTRPADAAGASTSRRRSSSRTRRSPSPPRTALCLRRTADTGRERHVVAPLGTSAARVPAPRRNVVHHGPAPSARAAAAGERHRAAAPLRRRAGVGGERGDVRERGGGRFGERCRDTRVAIARSRRRPPARSGPAAAGSADWKSAQAPDAARRRRSRTRRRPRRVRAAPPAGVPATREDDRRRDRRGLVERGHAGERPGARSFDGRRRPCARVSALGHRDVERRLRRAARRARAADREHAPPTSLAPRTATPSVTIVCPRPVRPATLEERSDRDANGVRT